MKLEYYSTPSGYMIILNENNKKCKLFLRDINHIAENSIPKFIANNDFILGKPFGNDIYPILSFKPKQKSISFDFYKRNIVLKYYMTLSEKEGKEDSIIKYARKLKKDIKTIGIDCLYTNVLEEISVMNL
jgi:hypothetical protein